MGIDSPKTWGVLTALYSVLAVLETGVAFDYLVRQQWVSGLVSLGVAAIMAIGAKSTLGLWHGIRASELETKHGLPHGFFKNKRKRMFTWRKDK